MIKITTTLLVGSICAATLLFSGCGSEATSIQKAPKDTTKLIRGAADDHSDWTWFVGTDGTQNDDTATFTSYYMQGIPTEVKHFQYFLDTDNNAATGFSFGEDSWRISGADILVEDGAIYKSESKSTWKWSYVGELNNYNRTKVDGIEQINFSANKSLLNITSNTINVTIEPFDANWGSTYSTISTQAVNLVNDEGMNDTPDPKLTQALLPAGVTIDQFLVSPDFKSAIVLTKGYSDEDAVNGGLFGYDAALLFVDYSDVNHPKLPKNIIISGSSGYPFLYTNKPIRVIDNNTLSFFTGNDNIYSEFKVIYDFKAHKELKRLPVDALAAFNLASSIYAKTLPNQNYIVRDGGNHKQLADRQWQVNFIVDRSSNVANNPLPDLIVTATYDEVNERIYNIIKHEK